MRLWPSIIVCNIGSITDQLLINQTRNLVNRILNTQYEIVSGRGKMDPWMCVSYSKHVRLGYALYSFIVALYNKIRGFHG